MLRRATQRWLLPGLGSTALTPLVLLVLVALAQWSLGARIAAPSPAPAALAALLAATLALVAAGCATLACLRPQRAGLSPPHVMLSLGFGGMLAGLAVDVAHAGPQQLDALCSASAALPTWLEALRLHAAFLPAMHAGMLAGGLLAIPSLRLLRPGCARALCARVGQNALCSVWMLLGMTGGALAMQRWLPSGDTASSALPTMLGGMFVGMTWGMAASVALVRAAYALRARR